MAEALHPVFCAQQPRRQIQHISKAENTLVFVAPTARGHHTSKGLQSPCCQEFAPCLSLQTAPPLWSLPGDGRCSGWVHSRAKAGQGSCIRARVGLPGTALSGKGLQGGGFVEERLRDRISETPVSGFPQIHRIHAETWEASWAAPTTTFDHAGSSGSEQDNLPPAEPPEGPDKTICPQQNPHSDGTHTDSSSMATPPNKAMSKGRGCLWWQRTHASCPLLHRAQEAPGTEPFQPWRKRGTKPH